MAQIIPFPGTVPSAVHQVVKAAAKAITKQQKAPSSSVVRTIRGRGRVPKQNREEDQQTIMFAQMAKSFADQAYDLAQTEANSENHRLMLHMAGIADKLPRNNLRIFTTPDDLIEGVWMMWRRVNLANLEWKLCDARRWMASSLGNEDDRRLWEKRTEEAEIARWELYERLLRIPATRLTDVTSYKLDRRFERGMGSIDWMRTHKPELAAIIDDEVARLNLEKDARKASRAAKKGVVR
jgi:hypothetical protein